MCILPRFLAFLFHFQNIFTRFLYGNSLYIILFHSINFIPLRITQALGSAKTSDCYNFRLLLLRNKPHAHPEGCSSSAPPLAPLGRTYFTRYVSGGLGCLDGYRIRRQIIALPLQLFVAQLVTFLLTKDSRQLLEMQLSREPCNSTTFIPDYREQSMRFQTQFHSPH